MSATPIDITSLLDTESARAHLAAAKIERLRAETVGQLIDNRTAVALADTAEIAAERERKTAQWEAVANSRVREYHFTEDVNGTSVLSAIDTLSRWHRIDSAEGNFEEYKFIICSPGGNVISGMKLYSHLKALATKRPIVTVASGFCASMATVIHQAGTVRVIEPGCSYLIHDVSGEAFGNLGSMQDTVEWMNKLNTMLHVALQERSNLTMDEIAALGKRRDGWFMPEEILKFGLADTLGYALDASVHNPIVKPEPPITPPVVKRAPRARKTT